jgi:hypothetical protein
LNHQQIVAYLREQHQTPAWWAQMMTVGYEQALGLPRKHQKTDGKEVSVIKTVQAKLHVLFHAWADEAARSKWFPRRKFTVRKAAPNKSLRLSWGDGQSRVEVNFYARGEAKSQVTCQHRKLAEPADVEKMRAFWAKALQTLKEMLEA